ncbi:hypothetical protein D3C87_300720 [compost metagenome]
MIQGLLVTGLSLALLLMVPAANAGTAGITYSGRLVGPSGDPVEGHVQFRMQVRTPNSANCLLFQETKSLDLTGKKGYFTLTLNDGSGVILNGSYALDRVFANQGKFEVTHPNLDCGGSTEYIPSAADGRKMKVFFRESSFAPNDWEELPVMDINFIPIAIESVQVGGFKASHLLRVQDATGVPQSVTAFSPAEFTSLLGLIDGTSTAYLKSSVTTGIPAPVVSGDPSSAAAGSVWFDSVTGKLKYHDGSAVQTLGTSGGSVSSVAAGTGLTTGSASPITATGTLSIADAGVDTLQIKDSAVTSAKLANSGVTAGIYGSAVKIPVITVDAKGRLTLASEANVTGLLPSGSNGEYLKSNGASWSSARIEVADIKSTGAGNPSFFNFTAACTLEKTLVYDSVNDRMNCTAIGINANQITAGTLDKARLPVEAVLDGGNPVTANMSVGSTTAQSLQLMTNGSPRLTISNTGNVGVGIETPSEKFQVVGTTFHSNDPAAYPYASRLAYSNFFLNVLNRQLANSVDNSTYAMYNRLDAHLTDNTSSKYAINAFSSAISVDAGVNNPGYARGQYLAVLRGSSATLTDSGNLANIYGQTVQYGHLGANPAATPTTSNMYGLQLLPVLSAGSIGTLYDIHIKSLPSGSSVTSHYGIYQEDLEAQNYLAGKVGVGVVVPSSMLHLKAGGTAAGTSPLKFTSGGLLSSVENGAMEYDGTDLHFTSGGTRRKLASTNGTGDYSSVGSIVGSGALNISAGGSNQNLVLAGSGTGQVQSSSIFHVTNTTASTSTTTGAMIVDGGLGVSGTVNAATIAATTAMLSPIIYGSEAPSGTLTLQGTSNLPRGNVIINPDGGDVGIGTTSMAGANLHVAGHGGIVITRGAESGAQGRLQLRKSRGTASAPTPTQQGDTLGTINFNAYNNGAFSSPDVGSEAYLGAKLTGSAADANNLGTRLFFSTKADGGTTNSEKMTILGNGNVGIGIQDPGATLDIYQPQGGAATPPALQILDGSAPTAFIRLTDGTSVANSYVPSIWAKAAGTNRPGLLLIGEPSTDANLAASAGVQINARLDAAALTATPLLTVYNYLDEKFRISAAGNVGIGTNDPTAMLHVKHVTANPILRVEGGGATNPRLDLLESGDSGFSWIYDATANNVALVSRTTGVDAAPSFAAQRGTGNVTIGSVNGSVSKLDVQALDAGGTIAGGSANPGTTIRAMSSDTAAVGVGGTVGLGGAYSGTTQSIFGVVRGYKANSTAGDGSGALQLQTYKAGVGWTKGIYLDQDGDVGIGNTVPSERMEVTGNLKVVSTATCILGTAAGGVNCTSDARLKDNVKIIPDALAKILQLRGVEFDWNQKSSGYGRHDIGVIAQEVEKVFPTLIHQDKSSGYKMVDYAGLVSPLIESTKELYGMCKGSEAKIQDLERKIASVESENQHVVSTMKRDMELLKSDNEKLKQENSEMKSRLERIEKMLQEK